MRTTEASMVRGHAARVPWQVSFGLLAAIWGCSFWWIKLGLEMLSPVQVAFVRLAVGATTLLLVSLLTGTPLPRRLQTWRHLFVAAMLLNSVPFTLFAVGETQISSVLAGIINATTPLTTLAVVLFAFPEEHPTRERVAGLVVGFVGVLVVIGVWQGIGSGEWTGIAACLGAVTCYGIAFPYTKRHLTVLPDSRVSLATGQVLVSAVVLLPFAALDGGLHGPIVADSVLGMLGLGALGSGIAYVLNYQVIGSAGSMIASSVTYLTPLFAVIAGLAFLGEGVAWYEPVGGLVVLLGVAISQGRLRPIARILRRSQI